MRAAAARRQASAKASNSTRWSFTGGESGCTRKTSFRRTDSSSRTEVSPSGNRSIAQAPGNIPRSAAIAAVKSGFAVPAKMTNSFGTWTPPPLKFRTQFLPQLKPSYRPLPLDAHEWFEPGHLPRQIRFVRRVDHLADIFVSPGRFFGDATHRRAADQNAAGRQVLYHVTAMPLSKRMMPAHAAPGSMAGGSERQLHACLRAREHIGGRSHRSANQNRLPHGPQ